MRPIKIRMFDDDRGQLDANEKALIEIFSSRGVNVDVGGTLIEDDTGGFEKALGRCRPEIIIGVESGFPR